jgi:hypothetical protein
LDRDTAARDVGFARDDITRRGNASLAAIVHSFECRERETVSGRLLR